MAMVFGRIPVETPKYEVVKTTPDYQIRKYSPSVAAEITYDPADFKGDKDGGFTILANYIGAFGKPQNKKPQEKIAMTAPVVTKGGGGEGKLVTMQFLLPEKYKKGEEAPEPVDDRVVLRGVEEREYGVVKFGGVAMEKVVEDKVKKVRQKLENDGYKIVGEFLLGRYNPPWITLPPFRTNEVMIPDDLS